MAGEKPHPRVTVQTNKCNSSTPIEKYRMRNEFQSAIGYSGWKVNVAADRHKPQTQEIHTESHTGHTRSESHTGHTLLTRSNVHESKQNPYGMNEHGSMFQ